MRAAITVMTAALIALGAAGAAGAATPTTTAYLTATLKADVKKTFKAKAPALTLGAVTCSPTKGGKVYHCLAHFTDASAKENIVVGINASRKQTTTHDVTAETIIWSTTTDSCTAIGTHAPLRC